MIERSEQEREQDRIDQQAGGAPEKRETLWRLTYGPLFWAAHFLLSYTTAAVWCAKVAGAGGSLEGARLAIAAYTLLALAGIGRVGWLGYSRASFGSATEPHDFDTAGDRHRFLGLATVLLCLLSFVATIYVALPILFFEGCR